ncbi:hypothetical protein PR048_023075 [Dryococelus australis]|uniref:Uncharacterized protein n=1 Tax=Dryococelus australis TaxID=614101 RepID=A0ABQ9GT21_9NEOP|nr:hypothetical protein PR048_023075 [Dryococelus australis]
MSKREISCVTVACEMKSGRGNLSKTGAPRHVTKGGLWFHTHTHARVPPTSLAIERQASQTTRGGGNGRSQRKTRRPAASFGTIPTCENPGVTRPGIELGSPGTVRFVWALFALFPYSLKRPPADSVVDSLSVASLVGLYPPEPSPVFLVNDFCSRTVCDGIMFSGLLIQSRGCARKLSPSLRTVNHRIPGQTSATTSDANSMVSSPVLAFADDVLPVSLLMGEPVQRPSGLAAAAVIHEQLEERVKFFDGNVYWQGTAEGDFFHDSTRKALNLTNGHANPDIAPHSARVTSLNTPSSITQTTREVIKVSIEQCRNERVVKREIPEKTRRPTASSGTIPTCENPEPANFALSFGDGINCEHSLWFYWSLTFRWSHLPTKLSLKTIGESTAKVTLLVQDSRESYQTYGRPMAEESAGIPVLVASVFTVFNINEEYVNCTLARKQLANPITERCGATASEHTANALVCRGGLRNLAYRSLNSRYFPIPENSVPDDAVVMVLEDVLVGGYRRSGVVSRCWAGLMRKYDAPSVVLAYSGAAFRHTHPCCWPPIASALLITIERGERERRYNILLPPRCLLLQALPVVLHLQRYDGTTARLARRCDEALGVRVSVARIAPSLLDLGRGVPTGVHSTQGCYECQKIQRFDGNAERLARRSDKALEVRASVARIAPSLLDLGRAAT